MILWRRKCGLKALLAISFFVNFLWMLSYVYMKSVLAKRASKNKSEEGVTTSNLLNASLSVLNANLSSTVQQVRNSSEDERPSCSQASTLVGAVRINFEEMRERFTELNMQNISKHFGAFEPIDCRPSLSVAIIIPFRDRMEHLEYLLGHLHPILERQLLR